MRWISFSAAVLFCGLAFGADEASDRARLAADLLDAMNMETPVSQSFEAAKAAIPAQMKQMQSFLPARPNGEKRGLPAEQTEKMMDRMLGMFATEMSWEKVKADYVTLYADTFTAAELEELLAFYRSAAGKSFVAKQPLLTRKSVAMSQKAMLRLMPKIIAMSAESAAEVAPPARVECERRSKSAARGGVGRPVEKCSAQLCSGVGQENRGGAAISPYRERGTRSVCSDGDVD